MEQYPIRNFDRAKDKLDRAVADIRYASGTEHVWEGRPNTLIENHPYLVGYAFMIGLGVLFSAFHLMTFAIAFLFLYFISDFMTGDVHRRAKFIPRPILFSVFYVLVIAAILLVTYKVIPLLLKNFPELTSKLQVQTVNELKEANQRWNLSQYIDIEAVKGGVLKASSGLMHFLLEGLSPLYKGVIQFIFALAINLFFYFEAEKIEEIFTRNPCSLMSFVYRFIQVRLKIFYFYFKRVMGGQVIISCINTAISSVAIVALGLPHPFLMIFIVFFCGLFPVVGNLISNGVLLINAFVSIGLWGSGVCLFLLVSIHKLEYFLNSRIIGGIVRLPMAVSLAALIFCEVILGIPGLILAIPIVLFLRHEFEHIPGLAGRFLDRSAQEEPEQEPAPVRESPLPAPVSRTG